MYYIDFDDFHENNHRLDLLEKLKERIPNFKVNLFTIPSKCSQKFLNEVSALDWVHLIPHGFFHEYKECARWTTPIANKHLDMIEEKEVFQKGFKAPYWETSQGLYNALINRQYWIADHSRNNPYRPSELKCYLLTDQTIHGHIQNVCGNGLEECFEQYAAVPGPCGFIADLMEKNNG